MLLVKCIWPTNMEAAGTLTLETEFHASYSFIISSEGRSSLVLMRLILPSHGHLLQV